ncbi:aminopeptidase N [Rhodoplanes serenus]|uniref:aminopeptidase N n=1 Tax=Rhodoplanes serenus TaxID=200615 RepID=UPI000DADF754|nr:aminopeptidase N [Rhodoplanes serenus]RAI33496.1 aminopeptidase N [Rhodoplanes serenus]
MRTEHARPIRLSDYRPPDWLVDTVDLDIALHPTRTRVRSRLRLRPNPQAVGPAAVVLDGDDITPLSVRIDGVPMADSAYLATPDGLTIPQPPAGPFVLEIETEIDPSANTKLMGLYRSSGNYCTQCEAEGFRRITFFPDRPDVMAVYTTRLEADRDEAPVLLGNGNLIEQGDVPGTTRHFAVWHDPFPKPCYLFALVGGRLGARTATFTTMSGRTVALGVYVESGKEERAGYALEALERSMRWDEQAFGREYDLDVFNIVAVADFNMGAMENKGLNIFNDKYILASPETATDADYAHIEAVIAHEYFHNWTGNRITCRDWFQLCLKEGLTVFRDQEFSSDMRSRPVKRIADVRVLRGHQFVEDAGPLAHPVRPDTYREINNFYTATVYEKGAEVVRMLETLLGRERFRAGMDLYFARHDGHAATVEEFVACFAEAAGTDLSQFMLWYAQAGTPELAVTRRHDAQAGTLSLEIAQVLPPTPGQPSKSPMVIPLALGLVGPDGDDLPIRLAGHGPVDRGVLVLTRAAETFVLEGVPAGTVPSLNRGFSAPVKINADLTSDDLRFLAAHDSDPFNRWQAVQTLASELLIENVAVIRAGGAVRHDGGFVHALAAVLADERLAPAYVAQVLSIPSEGDIARDIGRDVDPEAIYLARQALRRALGNDLAPTLRILYDRLRQDGPYSPDAASAGRRALRNVCLDLLAAPGHPAAITLAAAQCAEADNMTDRMAALATLALHDTPQREAALADFFERFRTDPLVIDKWFALQAMIPDPGTLDRVRGLAAHPAFSLANPNRVRALIGSFAQANHTQFNRADGEGYRLVVDTVLALDGVNPQVAARLATAFRSWRALEPTRRAAARAGLERLAGTASLSRDVADIVERSLGER